MAKQDHHSPNWGGARRNSGPKKSDFSARLVIPVTPMDALRVKSLARHEGKSLRQLFASTVERMVEHEAKRRGGDNGAG